MTSIMYGMIYPASKTARLAIFDGFDNAIEAVGLTLGEIDHGMLAPRLAYCVYERGLFVPPAQQSYFRIDHRLIAGPALLYAIDEAGDTVDLDHLPVIHWFDGVGDVEDAIARGTIVRPEMVFNDDVIWRWPSPNPWTREGSPP